MHASIDSRSDFDGDLVGIFAGNECRGIAERMYFPLDDSYYYEVQVYSNTEGEELHFKYYDSLNDEVVRFGETITFETNMIVGDGFNTYSLSREVEDLVTAKEFSIGEAYPNPFNPVTSFSYTMSEAGMVNVSIYDIHGRQIAELVNGYQAAGSYPVVWDANEVSSGVYMIKMNSGDHTAMQKIMLIK